MAKTKKQLFTELLELEGLTQEQHDFIVREMELIAKKNKAKEPDPEQVALENKVLDFIKANPNTSIASARKHVGQTSQKVTPIVNKLIKQGLITATTTKGVRYLTAI